MCVGPAFLTLANAHPVPCWPSWNDVRVCAGRPSDHPATVKWRGFKLNESRRRLPTRQRHRKRPRPVCIACHAGVHRSWRGAPVRAPLRLARQRNLPSFPIFPASAIQRAAAHTDGAIGAIAMGITPCHGFDSWVAFFVACQTAGWICPPGRDPEPSPGIAFHIIGPPSRRRRADPLKGP